MSTFYYRKWWSYNFILGSRVSPSARDHSLSSQLKWIYVYIFKKVVLDVPHSNYSNIIGVVEDFWHFPDHRVGCKANSLFNSNQEFIVWRWWPNRVHQLAKRNERTDGSEQKRQLFTSLVTETCHVFFKFLSFTLSPFHPSKSKIKNQNPTAAPLFNVSSFLS